MKKKPKRERKPTQLQQVTAELEKTRGKWFAATEKLEAIRSALGVGDFDDLEQRLRDLERRFY